MQNNESLVVPFFKAAAVPDAIATKREGRPIFRDVEMCEIRIAGDRNYAPVVPAKSMWRRVDGEEMTYAQRWPEQYSRFREGQEQVASGTPLSELPFLTEAKRAELRGLKIYTAEALASIDGKELRNIGPGGREMKDQATAYLATASGVANTVALSEEIAALRAELDALRNPPADDEAAEKEAMKARIAELSGQRPRGNPGVDTLRQMLAELEPA